ncbi:MAG: MCE family protein [Bacteroidetes bacterium]|nr:MCE family protein [Bacteroidota bacterium]
MKKSNLSRARVGFLIFVGVLAFTVGIFFVGEKSQLFSSVFYVQVNFASAEGVKPGAYVVLSGYNIGTVSTIRLTEDADSVRILLRVNEDIHPFIKRDSKAEIKQEGLVGNKFINLSIGSEKSPVVPNYGFIKGVAPFALSSLADNAISIMDTAKLVTAELNTLLHNINQGKGTIGRLMTEDKVYEQLASITEQTEAGLRIANDHLDDLSGMLLETAELLNRIVIKADTTIENTNRMTHEAAAFLENMNTGNGTLGALMNDRSLYDSVVTLLSALTDVSYDAGNAATQLSRSIHAMREHWLFGRVFAGEEFEQEAPPESAYQRKMRLIEQTLRELHSREEEIRRREQELGLTPKQ